MEIAGNNCICGEQLPDSLQVQSTYATSIGQACDLNDPCQLGTGVADEDGEPTGQLGINRVLVTP